MRRDPPDTQFFIDLHELNREFLALIRHPQAAEDSWQQLGLDAGIAHAVRRLKPQELEFAAGVPGLLAEFATLPSLSAVADDPAPTAMPAWLDAARVFAAALLTYLWQLSRRDELASALCVGLDDARRRELQGIHFREIQRGAATAAGQLRARYGRHPRLWPQLLQAARSREPQLREFCRLDLIALGLSGAAPPAEPHQRERRTGF
ncbi:MAG: hypothetical protein QNJ73_02195 [Gammaproteobacteria bacterium]|nr:hypothetical protein [Gammaproteobacteria bacterium]